MTEIVTPRLRLRRARPSDLDDLHAVMSHPEAMRYWSTPPHGDIAQTRDFLAEVMAGTPDDSDDFLVELADAGPDRGRVIGKVGCWRVPEIGYILHPDFWGRGLAREALDAVLPHVFARFPVDAVTADVDPRNVASLRLLDCLGFHETGRAERTWLVGDEWCDSVYLALPRPAGG